MNTFHTIRKRIGLTQAALAEVLGVSQSNVAHYERGQTIPPSVVGKLIACAQQHGLTLSFDEVYAPYLPELPTKKPARSRRRPTA